MLGAASGTTIATLEATCAPKKCRTWPVFIYINCFSIESNGFFGFYVGLREGISHGKRQAYALMRIQASHVHGADVELLNVERGSSVTPKSALPTFPCKTGLQEPF